jgi:hypothetical protein
VGCVVEAAHRVLFELTTTREATQSLRVEPGAKHPVWKTQSKFPKIMDPEDNNSGTQANEGKGSSADKEDNDKRSTPGKDLAASAVIAVFAVLVMLLALRMPNPGTLFTAPGLLPFLTGLALLIMAAGLGISSIRADGVKALLQGPGKSVRDYFADIENWRTLLLIGIIILYVIVTQQIAFDLRFPTKFFAFSFSSYELISIITLTLILRIFWRATLVRCLLVSAFWIIALASVFRYAFHILLPGLG